MNIEAIHDGIGLLVLWFAWCSWAAVETDIRYQVVKQRAKIFSAGAMLVLLLSAPLVLHAAPLVLRPCSKTTCAIPDRGDFGEMLLTEGITLVSESAECPRECSYVSFGTHARVHVMGRWLDLSCRIWGGDFCGWDSRVITEEQVIELMDKVVSPREK